MPDGAPSADETALRVQLAEAVTADQRVRVLDRNNRPVLGEDGRPRRVALKDAVEQDLAFFVSPREGALVGDFDGARARSSALGLHRDLLLAGYRPVLTDSGGGVRPGNDSMERATHLFVCIDSATERAAWAARLREAGADVRVGNAGIRPPLTRHARTENRSTLLHPPEPERALERLVTPSRARPLPPRVRAWVYEEVTPAGERSEVIWAVARYLQRQGWTCEEALLVLRDEDVAIGKTYAEAVASRNHPDDDWFRRHVWGSGSRGSAAGSEASGIAARLRTWARARPWPGRAGPSRRAVYEAFLDKAERAGRLQLTMSRRELNERTALGSPSTVINATRWLEDNGYLTRPGPRVRQELTAHEHPERDGFLPGAAWYQITVPDDLDPALARTPPGHTGDPAFRNGVGYGKGVQQTYDQVCTAPGSTGEIAVRRSITVRPARRHLTTLARIGLVTHSAGAWQPTALTPAEITPEPARQRDRDMRDRHIREREARTRWAGGTT